MFYGWVVKVAKVVLGAKPRHFLKRLNAKKVHFSSARTGENQKDKWQTPPDVFKQLDKEFNFTLDAAAVYPVNTSWTKLVN